MSGSIPVTKMSLDQLKEEEKDTLIVIDFHAQWCGPCKAIASDVAGLREKYDNKIIVLKVDVDDSDDLAEEYEVSAMPTFVFLKNGEEVGRSVGANMDVVNQKIVEFISETD